MKSLDNLSFLTLTLIHSLFYSLTHRPIYSILHSLAGPAAETVDLVRGHVNENASEIVTAKNAADIDRAVVSGRKQNGRVAAVSDLTTTTARPTEIAWNGTDTANATTPPAAVAVVAVGVTKAGMLYSILIYLCPCLHGSPLCSSLSYNTVPYNGYRL